ncbi:flap endonuclease-1 [Nematocida homosporus]|uniref:flap endonuclease-1 n=1 Tax=Nematocida homosporus TaxID=1912981 RepID=UPI00221F5227|nr:flap endonuclease-1 [Nematocida homosporus]KAI5185810.1 flap endonuclease-1 [Nematocida homosporus]
MGIHKLCEVIRERAPQAISQTQIGKYRGWKVAIDASMILYQSLVAIRYGKDSLTNAQGETTAHIQGILYKTVNLLEKGVTPLFVFDGVAPDLKTELLDKRKERKVQAEKALQLAEDLQEIEKLAKRTVRATKYHVDSAQELLRCLGVPYLVAPGEAEAYCSILNSTGIVDGVVTEDMDALAFGAKVLLRNFLPALMKKGSIMEIKLDRVLADMKLDQDSFVDLCILLGCDYCKSPKGVGPKKAFELIRDFKSINNLIANNKISAENSSIYKEAKDLFFLEEPSTHIPTTLTPLKPEDLTTFLVQQNNFDPTKVSNVIARMERIQQTKPQKGLLAFFKPK